MSIVWWLVFFFFFFNDTATTEIYTLSLHDALPISQRDGDPRRFRRFDQSDPARPRHRVLRRLGASHGGRLDAHQPPGPAPGGRAAQWSADASHGAGVHGGRGAGSDAALAARGIARDRRADRLGFH